LPLELDQGRAVWCLICQASVIW